MECPAPNVGAEAAGLRPRPGTDPVVFATKTGLRVLGRRRLRLDTEMVELNGQLSDFVAALVAAGDNPERLRSERRGRICVTRGRSGVVGKTVR